MYNLRILDEILGRVQGVSIEIVLHCWSHDDERLP